MSRRLAPPLALLGALATTAATAAEPPRRPNFLFIYTDDMRWDALGVVQREQGDRGRFPWVRTPNLDRLAAEGVRFRNAFVVNSLCAPSRASFLTGRYGWRNGIVNNHTPFPVDSVTHATLLRASGYATGYVGKFHMGSQRGPRPGFDFSASFIGQGRYADCPFEINGVNTPTRGWVDDVSTDYALGFLREHRDRPFLLVVGYKAAHGPFQPPARHANDYEGETARPVPNLELPPPYARGDGNGDGRPAFAARAGGPAPTNLNYFRCLAAVDDNVGRLLAALDEHKLADDTVVVFTSDNGFYLGEHRLGDKRSAYDESLRIPLLLRYPRLAPRGRTVDQSVLNIDVAPTFVDLAGVSDPGRFQGRSWRPLLEGRTDGWRNAFFYTYFYENGFRIPMVTAVRTATAKLIRYPGHDDWTELFDLAADPYETRNLIADPARAGLRRALEAAYDRESRAAGFRVPDFADDPAGERPRAARNAWVLDYRFDHDEGDRVTDASAFLHHGRAQNAPADAAGGRPARRFDGRAVIEVPKTPALDPAVAGWAVEATVEPGPGAGIVVASGGASNGYALHLDGGRPAFTVVTRGRRTRLTGPDPLPGGWVTLTGRITPGQTAELLVDGKVVANGRLPDTLVTPVDTTQIGADLGSPVLGEGVEAPRFVGRVARVRMYSGVVPAADH